MISNNMRKAISLMVRTNMTQNEIAEQIDVRPETISRWKKHEKFDEARQEEERLFLGDLASVAIQTYKDILANGKSEHVRYLVSQDILDRTGHKPVEQQEITASVDTNPLEDMIHQLKGEDE